MPPCRCWRGGGDPGAALGGPELRDGALAGRAARRSASALDGAPGRPAHRLEVDVAIGGAVLHRLERADRHAELHALARRSARVMSSARSETPSCMARSARRARLVEPARGRRVAGRAAERRRRRRGRRRGSRVKTGSPVESVRLRSVTPGGRGIDEEDAGARRRRGAGTRMRRADVGGRDPALRADRGSNRGRLRSACVPGRERDRTSARPVSAGASTASPAATGASQSRCCAALPSRAMASAASTRREERRRARRRVRAPAGRRRASERPRPMPPCAAGTDEPEQSRLRRASSRAARSCHAPACSSALQALDRDLLLEDAAREVADGRSDRR